MSLPLSTSITQRAGRSGRTLLVRVVLFLFAMSIAAIVVWVVFGRTVSPEDEMAAIRSAIGAKRYDRAEAMLVRRLARAPEDDTGWLMLGSLRAIGGRDDQAMAAFDRVHGPGPAWTQARTQLAEVQIRKRDAAGAERTLREVVERDPKAIDARRRLVYLLSLEVRNEEAIAVLRELYRLAPDSRHLITLVTMASPENGGRDEANKLEEYLNRTPDDPILRRARGLVLLRSGKPAEARPYLEAAVPAIEDDPIGRVALAECRLSTGDLAGVETALGTEPARPSDRAPWWVMKGQAEEARGRLDRAIAGYRKALESDPDDRTALYRLGQALARRGEADAARPLLDRAEAVRLRWLTLVLESDRCLRGGIDPGLFEHIAELCRDSGLLAESKAWYEQAIRLDPTRTTTQAALASIGEVSAPTGPGPPTDRVRDRIESKAKSTRGRRGRFAPVRGYCRESGTGLPLQRLAEGQPLPGRHDGRGRRPARLR